MVPVISAIAHYSIDVMQYLAKNGCCASQVQSSRKYTLDSQSLAVHLLFSSVTASVKSILQFYTNQTNVRLLLA
eukprot:20179-Heterococcus_DN1.PRE.4